MEKSKCLFRNIILLLFLFVSIMAEAQINTWQDVYKAKKKDTIYGIATKYGITVEQLKDANPEMKADGYQLKKGNMIFIPIIVASPTVSPSPIQNNKKGIGIRSRVLRVGIMLPLHQNDGDGMRMTEYYRGFLMACDEMKRQDISVEIRAWNVPLSADINHILLDKGAEQCDVIFGPLYTAQVKPLADFCQIHKIKLVIPFSIMSDEVMRNSQIFQVYQSTERLNQKAISSFLERFPNYHPVFIDCNDSTSKKGAFTFGLRKQLEAKDIKYNITNIKSSEELFAKAFSRTQPNVVILNTARSPELNIVYAKLGNLKMSFPNMEISMFGYTEWLMYTRHILSNLYKYDTYIPTTFYYNPLSAETQKIENEYRRWFKTDLQQTLPRFALVGYDHANFFIQGLHLYGKAFGGSKGEKIVTPVQTVLYFEPIAGGGKQNACFQLVHYKTNQTIDSLTY